MNLPFALWSCRIAQQGELLASPHPYQSIQTYEHEQCYKLSPPNWSNTASFASIGMRFFARFDGCLFGAIWCSHAAFFFYVLVTLGKLKMNNDFQTKQCNPVKLTLQLGMNHLLSPLTISQGFQICEEDVLRVFEIDF